MKHLKYQICNRANIGTEEKPLWRENLFVKKMPYTEANEEIAKKEAWGGEYTIEDDGQEENAAVPSLDDRVTTLETDTADLAEALDLILSGVTQ